MSTNEAMREALEEIHAWLVCWPIATAEDMGQSFDHMEQVAAAALASSAAAPEQVENLCPCKDRPADQCDEEWGPDCDLGNNAAYAQTAPVEVQGCADRPFLAGPPPLAGCRRAAHDLRGEGVTDNERSKA